MQLSKIGQFMHSDNSGAGVNMHSTQFCPGENRMLSFPSNSILLTSHTDYYADIAHTLHPMGQAADGMHTCQRLLRQWNRDTWIIDFILVTINSVNGSWAFH